MSRKKTCTEKTKYFLEQQKFLQQTNFRRAEENHIIS